MMLKQTVLIASLYSLGHAISTVFTLGILSFLNKPFQSKTEPLEVLINDLLYDRYRFEGYQFRYSDTPHPSALASIVFVFLVVSLGLAVFRRLPVRLSGLKMQSMPRNDRAAVSRIWKALLTQPKSFSVKLLIGFVLLGVVGAWIGLATDVLIKNIRDYNELHSLTQVFTRSMPTPFVGWFTASDALWIIFLVLLMLYVISVRPARKRIVHSHYINKRWCPSCGYPISPAFQSCPECGEHL